MKKFFSKTLVFLLAAFCLLSAASCAGEKPGPGGEQTKKPSASESAGLPGTDAPTDAAGTAPAGTESEEQNGVIEKIQVGADDTGIYAVVITLSDKVSEKGKIEMVYYGPKGTAQEGAVVNTFRIEYYKEDAGTYEVASFSDGEVYQNLHHQNKVKVNHTFSASVRAETVEIFYTPENGETGKVFVGNADQFR